MHNELIDILYEHETVEGLALFHDSGILIENQLAISELAVIQICACIIKIRRGLAEASREMKGFVIKNSKYILQVYMHGDLLILLQVKSILSAEKTYQTLQSQLGSAQTQSLNTAQKPRKSLRVVQDATITASYDEALTIDWTDFRNKLTKIIKRIAPSGIANKMINAAMQQEGLSEQQANVSFETAFTIGNSVVAKIPNASRRKLIEKEFATLTQQYQS